MLNHHLFNIMHEVCVSRDCFNSLTPELQKIARMHDPSVFPVLLSLHQIMQAIHIPWQKHSQHIGMLMCGEVYPLEYTQKVFREVQEKGRVSPLSFINANAGAAISVCCTRYNLQGPTLNLTMPNQAGETIAEVMITKWLNNCEATYVFWVTTQMLDDGNYTIINRLVCKH